MVDVKRISEETRAKDDLKSYGDAYYSGRRVSTSLAPDKLSTMQSERHSERPQSFAASEKTQGSSKVPPQRGLSGYQGSQQGQSVLPISGSQQKQSYQPSQMSQQPSQSSREKSHNLSEMSPQKMSTHLGQSSAQGEINQSEGWRPSEGTNRGDNRPQSGNHRGSQSVSYKEPSKPESVTPGESGKLSRMTRRSSQNPSVKTFDKATPLILPPDEMVPTILPYGKITVEPFGHYEQYEPPAVCPSLGEEVIRKYTMTNNNGVSVSLINYGATVISLNIPDKEGKMTDVLLGFDNINDYICECDQHYMGTTTGRYTGLISNAEFRVGNREHYLTTNHGEHHVNGGCLGFDKVLWQSYIKKDRVYMTYTSVDREECYPGCVLAQISFHLTSDNCLVMETTATSSLPTPICISHCLFFNLAGHGAGPDGLKEHCVMLNADRYVVVDKESQVPTGELKGVGATYYDFRVPRPLSKALEKSPDKGYDETFCLTKGYMKHSVTFAGRVTHPPTGRVLEIYTDHPGLHFYTASDFPNPDAPVKDKTTNLIDFFDKKPEDDDDGGGEAKKGLNDQWPRAASIPSIEGGDDAGTTLAPKIEDDECETPPPRDIDLEDPDYFPRKEITEECHVDDEVDQSVLEPEETEEKADDWVPPVLLKGKSGVFYRNHCGFTLVPMDYPDSMKHKHFPNPYLFPGETYQRTVMYKFSVAPQRPHESPSFLLKKLLAEQATLPPIGHEGESGSSRQSISSGGGSGGSAAPRKQSAGADSKKSFKKSPRESVKGSGRGRTGSASSSKAQSAEGREVLAGEKTDNLEE